MALVNESIKSGARKSEACPIVGISTRTMERWETDDIGDKRPIVEKKPINKLSEIERKNIINVCCSDQFKDASPKVIVPILAENGTYLASESTFYRVLRSENLLTHRTESKPPAKRHKPEELKATGPNQVLSWDITYLLSNVKGRYYYLYMFEDIWSRAILGWEIHEKESAEIASKLIKKICFEYGVGDINLHSDNGGPMKGATMLATLQKLGVIPSFSRPNVSNDNAFSEALFKTLKYTVGYPKVFNSIEDARQWVGSFVDWYNNEHRHSMIKYVTPMQRHKGEDIKLLEKREETYLKANQRNPERWSGKIRNWDHIKIVYLNPNEENNFISKKAS